MMRDPFHSLKHDHRVIERALRALDGVCTRLGWGERIPAEVLSSLVGFFSDFADRYHHGKEERYLFPALEQRGIAIDDGPLGVITREHVAERELTTEMESAVQAYREFDAESAKAFAAAAQRYTEHLLSHLLREDAILFRIADEVLDEEDKDKLAYQFRQAQLSLGPAAYEQLEQRATTLEAEWAI